MGDREGGSEVGAAGGWDSWGRRGPGGDGAPTGFGERAALRALFERLDTTPGQEKVIAQALAEFRKVVREVRPEWKVSREDVGRALRAESFDAVLLGEMFARHDRHLEEVRKAFVASMDKIHVALEPQQRDRLAALIEEGWFRSMWRFGRPYR